MKIRLGYISNPVNIKEAMYSRTMTYTNYIKIGREQGDKKLDLISKENLEGLKNSLIYNTKNDIHFYRLYHKFFPLATHKDIKLDFFKKYKKELVEIGKLINKNYIRVDTHPDQFCVLNSVNEEVVKNSIDILEYNYQLFQSMGIQGRTVLHIGSSVNGKEESLERFKINFNTLPDHIKNLIILENDDKIFNIVDVLEICEELKIPMVLDYHHYICNDGNVKLEKYIKKILNTWQFSNQNPKTHFSSPKSLEEKRAHSNYAEYKSFLIFLEILKKVNIDVDIMLECKLRNQALFMLTKELKQNRQITFLDKTTFVF